MRVREDDGVDRGRRKRKFAVARERLLAASLIETAVEQVLPAAGLDMMHRSGDGFIRAPEGEFHDFEYNHNYTMRKAAVFLFLWVLAFLCPQPAAFGQKKPITLEALQAWRSNSVRNVPG